VRRAEREKAETVERALVDVQGQLLQRQVSRDKWQDQAKDGERQLDQAHEVIKAKNAAFTELKDKLLHERKMAASDKQDWEAQNQADKEMTEKAQADAVAKFQARETEVAEDKSAVAASSMAKFQAAQDAHKTEVMRLQHEKLKAISDIVAEHTKLTSETEAHFQMSFSTTKAQHEAELAALEKTIQAQHQKHLENALFRAKEDYGAKLAKIIKQAAIDHETATSTIQHEREVAVALAKRGFEAELFEVKKLHAHEKRALVDESRSETALKFANAEKKIVACIAEFEQKIEKAQAGHEADVERLNAAHAEILQTNSEAHQQDKSKAVEAACKVHAVECTKLSDQIAALEVNLAQSLEAHAESFSKAASNHENEVTGLKVAHEAHQQELAQQYTDAARKLEATHAAVAVDYESKLSAARTALSSSDATAVASLAQLELEKAKLRTAVESALAGTQTEESAKAASAETSAAAICTLEDTVASERKDMERTLVRGGHLLYYC
jgi:predicted protein tyrosine phosphatase